MIRSMTGYGRGEGLVCGRSTTVEIRSVNGRHFEPTIRLPKEWSDKEHHIRECVKSFIERGSVGVYIRAADADSSQQVVLNPKLAEEYISALRMLKATHNLDGEITLDVVSRNQSLFTVPDDDTEIPDAWPELKAVVLQAATAMNLMRQREGDELFADLEMRIATIEESLEKVLVHASGRTEIERQRLTNRVQMLLGDAEVDQNRMNLEIVLIAEKYDTTEECVRLKSHLKFFREYMNNKEAAGRKLNFLLQEIHREINTIGSKSNDAEIALVVVKMKEEQERLREQIQNIE
ncbi:MAG: YicC family protein [Ignavibacteria bacterium]|nr:YicC family protein [Ignavibacteria bacterium]